MKALPLLKVNETLRLQDYPRPTAVDGEVIVQVAGCGVCHTDIGFWRHGVATRKALPLVLGHEISGTVVETGPDCKSWLGREVIVPAVIPCGDCPLCQTGRSNVCRRQVMPGNDIDGGFAEYIRVPVRGLCVVGNTRDFALAELAVVADAITTPYQAVLRSGLQAGEVAVVVGAGGVGGFCVQIAAACGAKVIAIDVDSAKLQKIAQYGAAFCIHSQGKDVKEIKSQVSRQAKQWGCQDWGWKIFECSGHTGGQQLAYQLLTHAATLLVIGFTLDKAEYRLSNLMAFDATAQGSWGCRPELYPAALNLVLDGKIELKPFIELIPLERGGELLEQVAQGALARRVILVP